MSKSIYEFKKGDIITRVSPSKSMGISILNPEGVGDRSYQGEKLIFIGIANGCIYLKRTNELELKIFGDKLMDLELDIFSEGWDYYIDPNSLLEDADETTFVSTDGIKEAIQIAISKENYEAADKLQKTLNKLKKNEKKKKN
jgi:hypothetical protein